MFKLIPNPTFNHEVAITTPDGPVSLSLEFKHQGKKALREWGSKLAEVSDLETIGHIVTGWSGVVDADGGLVNFSPAALASLIDAYPSAAQEIFVEYMRVLKEGRTKN